MAKTRIEWIDILKGIMLMFICFSHFGYKPEAINVLTMPTGAVWVPCFFFLSGILFNAEKYPKFSDYLIAKTKTLLLPYLVFFFIFLFFDWNLYRDTTGTLKIAAFALLDGNGPPKASPLWFVSTLYFLSLLYYVINRHCSFVYGKALVLFIFSFLGYLCSKLNINLPFHLDVVMSSVLFFGVAHIFRSELSSYLTFNSWKSRFLGLCVGVILMIISSIISTYNFDAVLGQNRIHNYILFYLTSFTGILSVIILVSATWHMSSRLKLPNAIFKFYQYIARNGLIILAAHCYVIFVVEAFIKTTHKEVSLDLEFYIKLMAILISIYLFFVPFSLNKLYSVLGSVKKTWRESVSIS